MDDGYFLFVHEDTGRQDSSLDFNATNQHGEHEITWAASIIRNTTYNCINLCLLMLGFVLVYSFLFLYLIGFDLCFPSHASYR